MLMPRYSSTEKGISDLAIGASPARENICPSFLDGLMCSRLGARDSAEKTKPPELLSLTDHHLDYSLHESPVINNDGFDDTNESPSETSSLIVDLDETLSFALSA